MHVRTKVLLQTVKWIHLHSETIHKEGLQSFQGFQKTFFDTWWHQRKPKTQRVSVYCEAALTLWCTCSATSAWRFLLMVHYRQQFLFTSSLQMNLVHHSFWVRWPFWWCNVMTSKWFWTITLGIPHKLLVSFPAQIPPSIFCRREKLVW